MQRTYECNIYYRDTWVGLESKIVLDGFKIALSLVSTVCINYFRTKFEFVSLSFSKYVWYVPEKPFIC